MSLAMGEAVTGVYRGKWIIMALVWMGLLAVKKVQLVSRVLVQCVVC